MDQTPENAYLLQFRYRSVDTSVLESAIVLCTHSDTCDVIQDILGFTSLQQSVVKPETVTNSDYQFIARQLFTAYFSSFMKNNVQSIRTLLAYGKRTRFPLLTDLAIIKRHFERLNIAINQHYLEEKGGLILFPDLYGVDTPELDKLETALFALLDEMELYLKTYDRSAPATQPANTPAVVVPAVPRYAVPVRAKQLWEYWAPVIEYVVEC